MAPSPKVRMYHPDLDTTVEVAAKTVPIRIGSGWRVAVDDETSSNEEETTPPSSGDSHTPATDEEIQ